MAQLEDLRPGFSEGNWVCKLSFMEEYRAKRYTDLNSIIEFNLEKDLEKSAKVPKEKKEKKVREKKVSKKKLDLSGRTPEELELLKKLGVL